MKRIALSAAAVAALSTAIYLAASGQTGTAYALITAAGPAPESGDGGVELDWPESPTEATVTEALVTVPLDADSPAIIRRMSSRLVPRGELPDGLTVCIGDCPWPAAVALPGSVGCERIVREPDAEPRWEPAQPCVYIAPGQWRGGCAPRPSVDVSELPLGFATPAACR